MTLIDLALRKIKSVSGVVNTLADFKNDSMDLLDLDNISGKLADFATNPFDLTAITLTLSTLQNNLTTALSDLSSITSSLGGLITDIGPLLPLITVVQDTLDYLGWDPEETADNLKNWKEQIKYVYDEVKLFKDDPKSYIIGKLETIKEYALGTIYGFWKQLRDNFFGLDIS